MSYSNAKKRHFLKLYFLKNIFMHLKDAFIQSNFQMHKNVFKKVKLQKNAFY